MVKGPPCGYFLELIKSILVMYPRNVLQVEAFFRGYWLQIVTGSCYLRGSVGSKAAQDLWMGYKMEIWRDSVATLDGLALWHQHTAYAGLQKSLQKEWAFVQRVTPDIGMAFQAVEDLLWEIFLLALFQGGMY